MAAHMHSSSKELLMGHCLSLLLIFTALLSHLDMNLNKA